MGRVADFFRDADLVIFDAMYSLADSISVKADWGHSSNVVGVELCQMAGGARSLPLPPRARARRLGDCSGAHRGAALRGDLAQGPPLAGDGRLRRNGNRVVNGAAGARSPHRRIPAIGIALLAVLATVVGTSERWNARLQGAWFDAYQMAAAARRGLAARHGRRDRREEPRAPRSVALAADAAGRADRRGPAVQAGRHRHRHPDAGTGSPSPERLLGTRASARSGTRRAARRAAVERRRSSRARSGGGAVVLGIRRGARAHRRAPRGAARPHDRAARALAGSGRCSEPVQPPGCSRECRGPRYGRGGRRCALDRRAGDVVRRIPLVMRVDDHVVPSMAIELLRVARAAPDVRLYVDGAAVDAVGVGGLVARTEADGAASPAITRRATPSRFVSAVDVLDGVVDRNGLRTSWF